MDLIGKDIILLDWAGPQWAPDQVRRNAPCVSVKIGKKVVRITSHGSSAQGVPHEGNCWEGSHHWTRQVKVSENTMFAKPWLKSLVVVSLMITKEVATLCYAFDITIPVLTHSAQVSLSYPVSRFIGPNYTSNFVIHPQPWSWQFTRRVWQRWAQL